MDTHALASIGHNSGEAPLAELLAEETADLQKRADDLIAALPRVAITDDKTASDGVTLVKMLKTCADQIEARRVERKKPYLEAEKLIDGHYKALFNPVESGRKEVIGKIDAYRREQEMKAAAERRRLEEEARRQAEEARKAEEAVRAAGEQMTIQDEIEIQRHREEAEALAAQAKAITAAPIVSGLGAKASGHRTWKAEITDLKAAIRHALKIDEPRVRAAIQDIYDRQARAGVRELPGATVSPVTTTIIR